MSDPRLEQAILALVARSDYRPAKPRVLAKELALSEAQREALPTLIKRLVKQGKLAWGPGHLVHRPLEPRSADEVVGTFRRMERGFGFVRPQLEGRPLDGQDVYISPENAGDASTGDLVRVRLAKRSGRAAGKREGRIVEVVSRDTHQFVGSYFESGGTSFVQVDGTVFAHPVAVGDPGAKNARPGDKVVFEMVRFPTHVHGGEGVITEVLGPQGAPGVDTLSIIREFALPEEFADDALAEARAEADRFDESIPPSRSDLTGQTVITIDPVDARDFDDAISLERIERGHWRLGVHIADVSHFVRPTTALDREALNRGTSVYLPDRVLPMLPEIISNSLASLQPQRVRYTKTAFIEFTPEGIPVGTELHAAAIRSARRFTYEEVDDYLAHPEVWKKKLSPEIHSLLGRMHELAMILRQRRMRRGALELTMNEVKVDLDRDGKVTGAHLVENTVSHQIIEEFMLAANEAVAVRLANAELFFLRRVHDPPDPRKLKTLTEFVAELGHKTESLESRFALQELLARVAGRPEQHAVNYAVLRSLQRAVYSPREEGHYALASGCYCHFTSPIRRYPDLTIHRLVDALLADRKPVNEFAPLVALGERCSQLEQRAEAAERELTKVKLLAFLAQRIGLELEAVVTGVESFGLFVQGIHLPAEGLIHISSLADDLYQFDRAAHTLAGRRSGNQFRLGDLVRVVVAHVDVERRELDFRLVERGGPAVGQGGAGRTAARPSRPGGHRPGPRPRHGASGTRQPAKPKSGSRAKPKRPK